MQSQQPSHFKALFGVSGPCQTNIAQLSRDVGRDLICETRLFPRTPLKLCLLFCLCIRAFLEAESLID